MSARMSAIEDLEELPAAAWWAQFRHGMGEKADAVDWFVFPEDAEMARDYTRGVAFGERSEARWWKRSSGKYHVVLIDDDGGLLEGAKAGCVAALTEDRAAAGRVLLWGERRRKDGNEFYEGRIPRRLYYGDFETGLRLGIVTKGYCFRTECWERAESGFQKVEKQRKIIRLVRVEGLEP